MFSSDQKLDNEVTREQEQVEEQATSVSPRFAAESHSSEPDHAPLTLPPASGSGSGRYFFSEILITAGPRKKHVSDPDADKDLGEDVCGFLSDGQQILLWLLDGTSDQYSLKHPENKREYFSSRLLAQSIAYKMRYAFNEINNTSLNILVDDVIEQVKTDWLQVLAALPAEEKNVLRANIQRRNLPECATTLLIGHLFMDGKLTAYRSGDSKLVVYNGFFNGKPEFTETVLARKNEDSNDRLFFRLGLSAEGEIIIHSNKLKCEIVQIDEVQSLIAYSDGIGTETERLIKQPDKYDLNEIRNLIINQTQGTADDKSICIVEIR